MSQDLRDRVLVAYDRGMRRQIARRARHKRQLQRLLTPAGLPAGFPLPLEPQLHHPRVQVPPVCGPAGLEHLETKGCQAVSRGILFRDSSACHEAKRP